MRLIEVEALRASWLHVQNVLYELKRTCAQLIVMKRLGGQAVMMNRPCGKLVMMKRGGCPSDSYATAP